MRKEDLIFSSLINNEEYARRVLPHIKPEYFQSSADKNFYSIYFDYFQKYNAVPSKQALLVEVESKRANANEYKELKEVISSQEKFTEKLDYLLKQTESFCKEAALYNAIKESVIIADSKNDSGKSVDAIPSILQQALSVAFNTTIGHDYTTDAMSRYEYYHRKEARISTGLATFDKVTKGGIPRKTLNVILAPPHGGKSLVMVNFGVGALKAGNNVLYITMEMAEEEIAKRFDVNLMNIEMDEIDIIPQSTFEAKFAKLAKSAMGRLMIKEFPTGNAHVGHFRTLLEELRTKQNFVPDMIIIDYMNICSSQKYKNNSTVNSYTSVMSIGQELRALAIETNTVVLTATQTTRSGAVSSDVDMTAISESFGINAIADAIWAILDSEELKKLNQIAFKQLKNRYRDLNLDNRFIMGIKRAMMKIFDIDNPSSIRSTGRNDKFDEPVVRKKESFDDFNF